MSKRPEYPLSRPSREIIDRYEGARDCFNGSPAALKLVEYLYGEGYEMVFVGRMEKIEERMEQETGLRTFCVSESILNSSPSLHALFAREWRTTSS